MRPQIVWKILSDGNWVMMPNGYEKLSDEWWVTSYEWWVMKIESNQKNEAKQRRKVSLQPFFQFSSDESNLYIVWGFGKNQYVPTLILDSIIIISQPGGHWNILCPKNNAKYKFIQNHFSSGSFNRSKLVSIRFNYWANKARLLQIFAKCFVSSSMKKFPWKNKLFFFIIHSGISVGFNFQSPSPNLNPPTWCNYSAEFEDRDRSSPLKPALKSNMRQHVTVGSNFSINLSDGCRKCGTFFFVKCTRIHVHAVLGDWLIYYISTLTLYISNIYTGFWHRHLPENSVRDIGVWQTT